MNHGKGLEGFNGTEGGLSGLAVVPELEEVLGKTLGVPLFQEQAMKIAIVAAGFTPSEADKLRRAMATFKRVGTIHTFRIKMIEGMAARDPREMGNSREPVAVMPKGRNFH